MPMQFAVPEAPLVHWYDPNSDEILDLDAPILSEPIFDTAAGGPARPCRIPVNGGPLSE